MIQHLIFLLIILTAVHCTSLEEHQTQTGDEEKPDPMEALLYVFGGGNPKRTPDGELIVEGDIVLPNSSPVSNDDQLEGRKATAESMLLWNNKVIPFTFHRSVSEEDQAVILSAMKEWEEKTCVKFRPGTYSDSYYVRFRGDMPGCFSLLGRSPQGFYRGQDVSIGKGCAQKNVVVHEIGHVIGFYHEQSRSDRDRAIHVNWENIEGGAMLQFEKVTDRTFDVPYDYFSVMQYPPWAFSKDPLNKASVVTLNPKYQRLLGKSTGLSFRDTKIANHLYSCNAQCPNVWRTRCMNGGYLKPYRDDNQDCACECPPNTSGPTCETVLYADYYDAIEALPCGGNITEETTIETPDYPRRTKPKQSCVWTIKAPIGKQVQLKFEGFSFAPRFDKPRSKAHNKCYNESVEIRLKDDFNGDFYCGTDIAPGTTMTSTGQNAMIVILADDSMIGSGLKAKISFVSGTMKPLQPLQPESIARLWERLGKLPGQNPFVGK